MDIKDVFKTVSTTLDSDSDHDVLYNSYIVFSYEFLKKAFIAEQNKTSNLTILDLINSNLNNKHKRDLYLSIILALREYIKRGDFESANVVLTTLEGSSCFSDPNINNISKAPCGCMKDNVE